MIAQQQAAQAATNQQPPLPGQQHSQSQPTSPAFGGPIFASLNLPPTPNLNGSYTVDGMHHPSMLQYSAAVSAPQFYPADQAFGGQFGGSHQGFAHH